MEQSTNKEPLVSIAMCAYNALPYIKDAVQAVLNQTYTNWELLISDDHSTDGTREWLQGLNDKRIRLFLQEKNLGYVCNKNFLHSQAKGEYITQLDSDDLCTADRLERQMAVIKRNPEIRMVAAGYYRIDDQGKIVETVTEERDRVITDFKWPYPFWYPSLMVHRTVFNTTGFFDEYFSGIYGDDLYWTVRANEQFPIYYINKPLYYYRNNPNSLTNVLDNKRKLIVGEILSKVLEQRSKTGTDWLEQKNHKALKTFEENLLQNKKFIAEKYRIWAAKAIDKKDKKKAKELLWRTFTLYPFRKDNFLTLFYYLRRGFS